MEPLRWHILYTRPQFERTVYQELGKKGIMAFLPSWLEIRQWSDRKKKISVPLFPGYVFVFLDQKHLHEALMVRGAVKFVSFADEIATVSEEEIERIRLLLSSDLEIEVADELPELQKGDHVFLEEGPLAGQMVEFIECKGKRRGLFKLEAIGKYLLVNLPLRYANTEKVKNF